MERIASENTSPIIHHLEWKYSLYTNPAFTDDSRYRSFTMKCNRSWGAFRTLEGITRMNGDVIVEFNDKERIVRADVDKKELLEVEGVDLGEMKHNEIVDLSVEGERWEGDVLNGEPYGWGVLYDKDNQRVYEGFRVGALNVCYGREYYADISRLEYEGEWCEGLRWGRGVQMDRNGVVVYDGEWLNGVPLEKRIEVTSADVLLHNHIEALCVSDMCCNKVSLMELDLSVFVHLRELKVGDNCFKHVKKVVICGLNELESVVIGSKSFTKLRFDYVPNDEEEEWIPYPFLDKPLVYMKNCPKLRELRIGSWSFFDYKVIEIENVDALEVIEMGDVNEKSYNFSFASLELKSILIHDE